MFASIDSFLIPPAPADAETPSRRTILGMGDGEAATILPIVAYWALSAFYETIHHLNLLPQYRVYPDGEEKKRNLVSRWETFRIVVVMHAVQIAFGLSLAAVFPQSETGPGWGDPGSAVYFGLGLRKALPHLATRPAALWTAAHALRLSYLGLRQLLAFAVFDTWAYWVHYVEHMVPFLYRNIHAVHHRNYVPYSFAASYNHPVEGFFNDILGSYVAMQAVGLTDREGLLFFIVATVKAVDDHATVELPYNPIRLWGWMTGNGMEHHNIHHQIWGLKTNFGLYFTFWDRLMNTIYTGSRKLNPAKGGSGGSDQEGINAVLED